VDPPSADLQAFLTAGDLLRHPDADLIEVRADSDHHHFLSGVGA
jgi:hypothetical protein